MMGWARKLKLAIRTAWHMWLEFSMKRMKGHVAFFPSWLRDTTSKSVDKSESGLFDSDCRHFFRRSGSENLIPFSHEKVSFCPSLSPTFAASFWKVLCMIMAWLIDYTYRTQKITVRSTAPIIYHLRRTIHIIKVAMQDKLCYPRSPRNPLRVVS